MAGPPVMVGLDPIRRNNRHLAMAPLTPAETMCVAQLVTGRRRHEIADDLGISYDTLKTHLRHAYRKLGVVDAAGAVHWYLARAEAVPVQTADVGVPA